MIVLGLWTNLGSNKELDCFGVRRRRGVMFIPGGGTVTKLVEFDYSLVEFGSSQVRKLVEFGSSQVKSVELV